MLLEEPDKELSLQSNFEKDKAGGGRPSVNIVISGVGETVSIDNDIIDVEDVDDRS